MEPVETYNTHVRVFTPLKTLSDKLKSTGVKGKALIEVKLLQPLKASAPIELIELGILILVKPLQFLKALNSILLTVEGKFIEVKPLQVEKASPPIFTTA